MDLSHVIVAVVALLTGVVAALKIIAPLTKNTVDDKVLAVAEKVEDVATGLAAKK